MAITSRLLNRKQTVSVALERGQAGSEAVIATGTKQDVYDTIGSVTSTATSFYYNFPCYELTCSPEIAFIERDLFTSSLTPVNADIPATQFARVTFKVDMMSSARATSTSIYTTADTEKDHACPAWTMALLGCGMYWKYGYTKGTPVTGWEDGDVLLPSNTPVQGAAYDYDFSTGDGTPPPGPTRNGETAPTNEAPDKFGTLTIKWWSDGRLYVLKGGMGNCVFSGTAGEIPYATFEFLGILVDPTGGATDPTAAANNLSDPDAVPEAVSQTDRCGWELYDVTGSATPPISTWEFNLGNSFDVYKDVNKAGAAQYAMVYEKKPMLTITTLAYNDSTSSNLLINKMTAGATGFFQTTLGTVVTDKQSQIYLGAKKTQITSLEVGEENGYATETATCKILADGTSLGITNPSAPYERGIVIGVGEDCDDGNLLTAFPPFDFS